MTTAVQYVNPEGACPAQGLYSHVGVPAAGAQLLFVAGQLSVAADGSVAGKHDFDAQFHQIFSNLGVVLKGLGCDFNDVVKFTTYLPHSQDIEHFMRLRAELFPKIFKGPLFPPNTLLVVDRLVKEDFLLEVEAIVQAKA
ncbi:MAG TPA: RidA family protein [Bordetella sp.]